MAPNVSSSGTCVFHPSAASADASLEGKESPEAVLLPPSPSPSPSPSTPPPAPPQPLHPPPPPALYFEAAAHRSVERRFSKPEAHSHKPPAAAATSAVRSCALSPRSGGRATQPCRLRLDAREGDEGGLASKRDTCRSRGGLVRELALRAAMEGASTCWQQWQVPARALEGLAKVSPPRPEGAAPWKGPTQRRR